MVPGSEHTLKAHPKLMVISLSLNCPEIPPLRPGQLVRHFSSRVGALSCHSPSSLTFSLPPLSDVFARPSLVLAHSELLELTLFRAFDQEPRKNSDEPQSLNITPSKSNRALQKPTRSLEQRDKRRLLAIDSSGAVIGFGLSFI